MNKEVFVEPTFKAVVFDEKDIICTDVSGNGDEKQDGPSATSLDEGM